MPNAEERSPATFPTHATDATVVEGCWDKRADWALLKCTVPPPSVRPIPLSDAVSDSEPWETFGFPDANPRDGHSHGSPVFVRHRAYLNPAGVAAPYRESDEEGSITPARFSISSKSCGSEADSMASSALTAPAATSFTSDWSNVHIP